MLTTSEQEVVAAIDKQLDPINEELAKAQNRVNELTRAKERLEAARAPFGKAKSGADEKTVLDICLVIVKENAPIAKADLESLAKDKLRERGFTLTGVHKRLQSCIAGKSFRVGSDDSVCLANA